MDTNGNGRVADVDNGVYYNGIANIQLTDTTCTFHQVDYQDYSGILGSTSRSNVTADITNIGSVIITLEKDKWVYSSGSSTQRGDFDLPVQGTYSNASLFNPTGWIKIGGKTYTKSKSAIDNEVDENDK